MSEESVGTDIERRSLDQITPRIEAMADELPALIKAGDTKMIKRWRDEGNAAALAARKLGYEKESEVLARHALRCAASLGVIDGELAKRPSGRDNNRNELRLLGAAMKRGLLEQVLDSCRILNQREAAARVNVIGAARVKSAPVRKAVDAYIKSQEINRRELATRSGVPEHYIYRIYHSPDIMLFWPTWHTIRELGVPIDVCALPPAPVKKRLPLGKSKTKWLTHRFREGDGDWKEALGRWYKFRDEVRRCGLNNPLLYEAMHTISDILHREITEAEK